jgi:crossover junction endodeoxyribonuclease RuvC
MLDFGCIKTSSKLDIPERLDLIHQDLISLLKQYHPDVAGVEKLFFEANVKTAINVAQARGVIIQTIYTEQVPILEPTPLEVKMNVTGDGRADKLQIQSMVQRILNLDSLPKPDDAADALAIALCASSMYKIKILNPKHEIQNKF